MEKNFRSNGKGEDVSRDTGVHSPDTNMQDVNEESLLRALDRIGSRRQNDTQKASPYARRATSEPRRRRSPSERDVIVTRQSLARATDRVQASKQTEDLSASLDRLKLELKAEQQRNEVLARDLEISRNQLKAAEAHLMHARLRAQDLENSVKQKEARLVALHQTQEPVKKPALRVTQPSLIPFDASAPRAVKSPKTRGRKPRIVEPSDAPEPEPVRWWKD